MSRSALQLQLLLAVLPTLVGCSHGERQPTLPTPEPTLTEAPQPAPPPRVSIELGAAGAAISVADDRCVTVAARELCGRATLDPTALGGRALGEGWVIPATALTVADATVTLEVGAGIEALGPLEGEPSAYLRPGEHTQRLRGLGWVELAHDEMWPTPESRLESYQRAAIAIEASLGAPRRRMLWSDAGDVSLALDPENPVPALVQAWLMGEPDWWTRGVADYLALLVEHQAGALPTELAYDELLDRYTRHRRNPSESPTSAEGQAAADIGALVAFCVDVELRTQSTSLLEALGQSGEGPLSPNGLLVHVGDQHPEIAARHRGRVGRRGVIELDGCLRRGGRKLIAHHVPLADPARLLGVGALDADTAEVQQRGRGPLRPGDVIRNIRGRAIRRAWDVVFYLRDLGGRHRFSVSVQRGEETIRTWLRMVAIDDDLPTRVRFTAVEDSEADNEGDPFRGPVDDRH